MYYRLNPIHKTKVAKYQQLQMLLNKFLIICCNFKLRSYSPGLKHTIYLYKDKSTIILSLNKFISGISYLVSVSS